ncbi:MAG TPA: MFS transporter [Actinophytocola sp.]|uniref:MFS transporter n=1 Tax=Actinophytocola sp. TaxID=1872138 RepID=UPI002DB5EFB1|nr:MFS transporter [Actinophytocola sp.]HEU5469252.1 MFS transporter [Actinophytocola sp.]
MTTATVADRDLRRFLAGQVASVFGTSLTSTAMSVIAVVGLGSGPAEVSLIIGAGVLPALVFGPVIGVLLDRVRRPRRMLIGTDLTAAVAVGAVALVGLAGMLSIAVLIALNLVLGCTRIVMEGLYFSHLNGLGVSDLGRARGRLQSAELVAGAAAGGVAGPLAAAVSAALLFLGDALTYLISAAFLMSLRSPDKRSARAPERKGVAAELRDGFRVVREHSVLAGFLGYVLIAELATGGISAQRAVFLLDELGLPVALFTVPAIAATLLGAVGALLAPRLLARGVPARRLVLTGLPIAAVLMTALPLAGGGIGPTLAIAAVGIATPALFGAMSNIALVTMISADIGDEYFARITTLLVSAGTLSGLAGLLLGAGLGERVGLRAGIWLCVALGVLAAAVLVIVAGRARPVRPAPVHTGPRIRIDPLRTLVIANRYPQAHRDDAVDVMHGHRLVDAYRWLEDPDRPATRRWLAGQRELAEDYIATLPGQRRLGGLLRSLLAGPTASPVKSAGSARFRVGRTHDDAPWVVQVADEPDAAWRTAIGPEQLGDNATVRRWQPSPSGRFLAMQVVYAGAEDSTPLILVDVPAGAIRERCELTRYTPVAWRADESGYFYVRRPGDRAGAGVYFHRIGTGIDQDLLLLGDDNPLTRYHITLWHDRWLVVSGRIGAGRASMTRIVDLAGTARPAELPLPPVSAAGLSVDRRGRILAISTERAECGELLVVEPDGRGGWGQAAVLVPDAAPAVLTSVNLADDRIVALYTRDGYSEMAIHDARSGRRIRDVELPGEGTVAAVGQTDDPATLAVSYVDWVTPLSVWRLDIETGRVTPAAPDIVRHDEVAVLRTTYRSFDGTEVPLTLLTRHDSATGPHAPGPTVLTCYGGFGISFRPSFQVDALSWVLVGGTLAIAGVRGGGERGRRWHREGSGAKKVNALRDLHAAGDWLVANGWTSRERLALLGGSNGGLVVTAALVQRPTDYAALACHAAPLDMVRYERWGLGRAWRAEYGSAEDPDALAALLGYSPYHNVGTGSFPAMWFSTGSNDTRVDPAHSRKMVALLQQTTSGGPVLLSVARDAGHQGGGPDTNRLGAAMLAFLAVHTGLSLEDGGRR